MQQKNKMPTYLYKCKECDSEFEEIHRIAERELPLDTPCEICGGKVRLIPQIPAMVSMQGSWRAHTSDGWKDTLREIKKNNPGSTLDI